LDDEMKTTTIKPPYDIRIQTASADWIHHVDADGKPAGGTYNGIPYTAIDELFEER
jgi:hypothetical protein